MRWFHCLPYRFKPKTLCSAPSSRSRQEPKPFTNEDVATAAALADFTAIALGKCRTVRRITAIGDHRPADRRLQHAILPRSSGTGNRAGRPVHNTSVSADDRYRFVQRVNDTFGHLVGNKVLTQIAKTLENTVATRTWFSAAAGMSSALYFRARIWKVRCTSRKKFCKRWLDRHSELGRLFRTSDRQYRPFRISSGKPFRNPRRRSRSGALRFKTLFQKLRQGLRAFIGKREGTQEAQETHGCFLCFLCFLCSSPRSSPRHPHLRLGSERVVP